ncbi:MAG: transglycosylase domain-containing protein [Clostridiales bacterium]|nr:transglycosylase domain-containing protein [Clostridiales bacterium]
MIFNNDAIKKELSGLLDTSRQARRHHLIFLLKIALAMFLILCFAGFAIGIGFVRGAIDAAPSLDILDVQPQGYASQIYDADGNLMQTLVMEGSNREEVSFDQLPDDLVNAFIAIEDSRFYEHNGIDLRGILRAAYVGITNGRFSEGASTITQQLIKNNVLQGGYETSMADKLRRKIQEQFLAVKLEDQLGSKETILEYYLNTINLGGNCLGVQTAAHRYFGKNVWELTLSECTVLAATTSNPSRYNPLTHPKENAVRRKIVLEKMYEQNFITYDQKNDALDDDVYSRIQTVDNATSGSTVFSYFTDAVYNQVCDDLQSKLGYSASQSYKLLYSGGLQIYSTMDPSIQAIVDEEINNADNYISSTGSRLLEYSLNYALTVCHADGSESTYTENDLISYFQSEKKQATFANIYASKEDIYRSVREFKASLLISGDSVTNETITPILEPQESVVVMNQSNGQVAAISGGRGEKEGSLTLNRALHCHRQPGSASMIISTFAPAIDSCGATLASTYYDAPYSSGNQQVLNWWGNPYLGYNNIRQAITYSMNVIGARCLTSLVSDSTAYDYLELFGLGDASGQEISFSLANTNSSYTVTNEMLTAAFASIANDGIYQKPTYYTKVLDRQGNILLESVPSQTRIIKSSSAALLTNAMEDVISSDSSYYYQYGITPTGTLCQVDSMTLAGKSGTTTSGSDVWFIGYSPYYTCGIWSGYDDSKVLSNGTEYHKTIWQKIMARIHTDLDNKDFVFTDELESAKICSKSGLLAVDGVCNSSSSNASVYTEYFAPGTAPTSYCDRHYALRICTESGKSATKYCPGDSVVQRVYLHIDDNDLSSGTTTDSDYLAPSNLQSCDIHTGDSTR